MKIPKVVGKCALVFVVFMLVSCGKENMNYKSEFEKSHKEWLKLKATWGNSYRYEVSMSSWTGYNSRTIISVVNGKVTNRSFKSQYEGQTEEWTESEGEIGTHPQYGAEPLTLDEVYDRARTEWLVKREYARYYFETKNNGLISSCGYVDSRCADDCFKGISINYVEGLLL